MRGGREESVGAARARRGAASPMRQLGVRMTEGGREREKMN